MENLGDVLGDSVYYELVLDIALFSCCSATLGSATNQVYQALAQLLKLCDDVLLHGDQSSALDTENVTHIIGLVEEAVKNLVALANEKIANRQKPTAAPANNRYIDFSGGLRPRIV